MNSFMGRIGISSRKYLTCSVHIILCDPTDISILWLQVSEVYINVKVYTTELF